VDPDSYLDPVGSRFNDHVDPYPDPDWAKFLDPDPDPYPDWINPDPQPWKNVNLIRLEIRTLDIRPIGLPVPDYPISILNTAGRYNALMQYCGSRTFYFRSKHFLILDLRSEHYFITDPTWKVECKLPFSCFLWFQEQKFVSDPVLILGCGKKAPDLESGSATLSWS
jgi:hypothetical protein